LNSQNNLILRKFILEPIIGNVVISVVHAPMYVVPNKGEKVRTLYGIIWYHNV